MNRVFSPNPQLPSRVFEPKLSRLLAVKACGLIKRLLIAADNFTALFSERQPLVVVGALHKGKPKMPLNEV